jgi:hypothetical protein
LHAERAQSETTSSASVFQFVSWVFIFGIKNDFHAKSCLLRGLLRTAPRTFYRKLTDWVKALMSATLSLLKKAKGKFEA